jgi:hypothetical protein
MNYKSLPENFTQKGWIFSQVKREGDIAIFSKLPTKFGGKAIGYEVIKIQKNEANDRVFKDKEGKEVKHSYEAQERYPSSEEWGTYGFTATTLEQAEKIFQKLIAAKNEKLSKKV